MYRLKIRRCKQKKFKRALKKSLCNKFFTKGETVESVCQSPATQFFNLFETNQRAK